MVEFDTVAIVVLGFFGGLAAIVYSYITFKHYQLIRDTPTSKIQSVSVGLTEVKGTVVPYESSDGTLVYKHPLEGEDVVYYDIKVEEYRHNDDRSNWHTIHTEERGDRFFVDDGTGQIGIVIEEPRFELDDTAEMQQEFDLDKEKAPKVLQSHHNDDGLLGGMLDDDRYRITVKAIYPSDEVFVFGSASIREGVGSSTNEDNLVIKNPGGGRSRGTFDFGQPQIISTLPEDELQGSMKWQIPAAFLGGLAVSAVCLTLLLSWFL